MNLDVGCLALKLLRAALYRESDRDSDLVARALHGDPTAFDELVRRHQKRIYNLSYRMLRRHDDAEDVTQEAFLKAFQTLNRLRDKAAFGSYVGRITANLCVAWVRRKQRDPATSVPGESLADTLADPNDGEVSEIGRRIHEAITRLPPTERLAIVAYYLGDRSYEEAAQLLGIGLRAFKTRLYRARKRLREMLCDNIATEDQDRR